MHIGLICDSYPPHPHGGVVSRVVDLATGLVERGHQVTAIGVCPDNRGLTKDIYEEIEGVRVVRLKPASPKLRWRPRIFANRLKQRLAIEKIHFKNPFHLIEATDGYGVLYGAVPRRVPRVIRIEGSAKLYQETLKQKPEPFYWWLEEQCLKRADFLVALSSYAREATLASFGLQQKECRVIWNSVETTLFAPNPSLPTEKGLITFVNGIEPRKGVRELLIAMNAVCDRCPQARLLLIGGDTEPKVNGVPWGEHLLRTLVKPEYQARITFAGRMDRKGGVLEHLQKAEVCCYPSHLETFGVAPLEAMSVGKPTIYSNIGPGPELIEDGVSGLLCDPFNPADIAEKLVSVLNNPEFARCLGENGRKRAVEVFDKKRWVDRNIAFYEEAIEKFLRR